MVEPDRQGNGFFEPAAAQDPDQPVRVSIALLAQDISNGLLAARQAAAVPKWDSRQGSTCQPNTVQVLDSLINLPTDRAHVWQSDHLVRCREIAYVGPGTTTL